MRQKSELRKTKSEQLQWRNSEVVKMLSRVFLRVAILLNASNYSKVCTPLGLSKPSLNLAIKITCNGFS
jgi:hypothetical protein